MKLIKNITACIIAVLFISSCVQEAAVIRSKVCITSYHHERVIPFIKVYVKYNAERFPGYDDVSVYDAFFEADANGKVCIDDIQLGAHWFAGFGYDDLFEDDVQGSLRLNVNQPGFQKDTIIYVSE